MMSLDGPTLPRVSTCNACLRAEHRRCESTSTCACSVCAWAKAPSMRPGASRSSVRDVAPESPARAPQARSGAPRRSKAPRDATAGPRKRGRPAGHSYLPLETQQEVERLLAEGWTLSGIGRELNISRDQARTIAARMERTGQATVPRPVVLARAEVRRLEGQLERARARLATIEAETPA